MTLFEAIDAYITLKRSLGAVFSSDARILRSFARALGDIAVHDIDPEATREFCRGKGAPTRWWERKDETLRGFFAWLVNRGHLAACPLPAHRPRVPRSFQPYIYSREELQRLLDATAILQDCRFPLRHTTFRTLLLVLYGAGLRPGEGLRLRCHDVDLRERVLTISDTKFFKSRLVPIGAALTDCCLSHKSVRDFSDYFWSSEARFVTLLRLCRRVRAAWVARGARAGVAVVGWERKTVQNGQL